MTELLPFLSALAAGAVVAAMPLLLAGLGEQVSERAGVLNVGLEGMMLAGAFAGFAVAEATGSAGLGFLAGAAVGAALGAVMVLLCVLGRLDQIVIGIAITLTAEGLTALLHHILYSRSYPRLPAAAEVALGPLAELPIVGPALFDRHPLVYGVLGLAILVSWTLHRTRLGLALVAAGSAPAALDAAGGSVVLARSLGALSAGTLGGLGGAYLAIVGAGLFVPHLTNGAGFIAIVLAMIARDRVLWLVLGALLYGLTLSLATAVQVFGYTWPTELVDMLPFLAVLLALFAFGRRGQLPAALAQPFRRSTG